MATERSSLLRAGQCGAAMLEFAVTLIVFVLVVLGIAEFALLTMNVARTNEVTREMARIAVVRDPLCDIWGGGCPGGVSRLMCPGGAPVSLTLADAALSCGADPEPTGCLMLDAAQRFNADILPGQVTVTYACAGVGSPTRPDPLPLVTVSVEGLTHDLIFPELFGLANLVNVPPFETTRTGEDMYTERLP